MPRSLEGHWREDVLFELRQVVEGYDFYQKQIAACDQELQKYLAVLPERVSAAPGEGALPMAKGIRRKAAHIQAAAQKPARLQLAKRSCAASLE